MAGIPVHPDFESLDSNLSTTSTSTYSLISQQDGAADSSRPRRSPSSQPETSPLPSPSLLPNLSAPPDQILDSIPFRAQRSYRHATWARTFRSTAELLVRPETTKEVQAAVRLARRCRRRLVVFGAGHSPSELTCSSSWMMSLDSLSSILHIDREPHGASVLLQAGITLRSIYEKLAPHNLTLANLGSIDVQSLAGAIATGTHGSSMQHGLLSGSVDGLRIVLADGSAVWCSGTQRRDLFRAALVSLGAIGVITEISLRVVPATNIAWTQSVATLDDTLARWSRDLWTQSEYVRCWWMPYGQKMIVWRADKTSEAPRAPKQSFYGGALGYHVYQSFLWAAHYVPAILPAVEWLIFGLQYRFSPGEVTSAVEPQHEGLRMDCLFSQFVNEWALPLAKGPEAIRRLSAWIHGDEAAARIPGVSSRGIYVHCPIEVRVSCGPKRSVCGYMDPMMDDGATLYLNATLYRPYGLDPPCTQRYYAAFEILMKELGGRPHWAKNFATVSRAELRAMYGDNFDEYLSVRSQVDPSGMFVGPWQRKHLLGDETTALELEEIEIGRRSARNVETAMKGGIEWLGAQADGMAAKRSQSEESFDFIEYDTDEYLEKLLERARQR